MERDCHLPGGKRVDVDNRREMERVVSQTVKQNEHKMADGRRQNEHKMADGR